MTLNGPSRLCTERSKGKQQQEPNDPKLGLQNSHALILALQTSTLGRVHFFSFLRPEKLPRKVLVTPTPGHFFTLP